MLRYLNTDLTFNLSIMMRSAWARAREAAKYNPFSKRTSTPRAEFAFALSRVWAEAKAERALKLWAIAQDAGAAAEAARRATLPVHDRQIEDARTALMFAEHNDTVVGHRLVAEARTHLDQLQRAA